MFVSQPKNFDLCSELYFYVLASALMTRARHSSATWMRHNHLADAHPNTRLDRILAHGFMIWR